MCQFFSLRMGSRLYRSLISARAESPQRFKISLLEYFKRAVDRMFNTSRDAPTTSCCVWSILGEREAALQLAAMSSVVDAVVGRSPSFVRWEGISAHGLPGGPGWTLSGRPLPYIPSSPTVLVLDTVLLGYGDFRAFASNTALSVLPEHICSYRFEALKSPSKTSTVLWLLSGKRSTRFGQGT